MGGWPFRWQRHVAQILEHTARGRSYDEGGEFGLVRKDEDLDGVAEDSVELGRATPRTERSHRLTEQCEREPEVSAPRGEERALKERRASGTTVDGTLTTHLDALRPGTPRRVRVCGSFDRADLVERLAKRRRVLRLERPLVPENGAPLRQLRLPTLHRELGVGRHDPRSGYSAHVSQRVELGIPVILEELDRVVAPDEH